MDGGSLSRRRFGVVAGSLLLLPRGNALGEPRLPEPSSPTLRGIRASGKLRVVTCPGTAPFVVAGPDVEAMGQLTASPPSPRPAADGRLLAGLDVDLAGLLAQALGVALEIAAVERFDMLFERLGKGEADVAISGVTRTLERAASLSFSQPYLLSGLEVLVREGARFAQLDAVNKPGVRVGVRAGTTAEAFASRSLPEASRSGAASNGELWQALDAGSLDAVVADALAGRDAVLRKRLRAKVVAVERRRVSTESIAMAARQGDADFTEFLSLAVREARASGELHRIAHRYNPWLKAQR